MGKRFRELTQTATDADFAEGNYFGVDTPSVTKKLPANLVAKASDVASLELQTTSIDNSLKYLVDTSVGALFDKNSVWDDTYPNQVCNANGLSSGNTYISYGLVITANTPFYFATRSKVYCSICVFASKDSLTGGTRYRYKTNVGADPEDNLPYENNPINLTAGQYVVISTRKEDVNNIFEAMFSSLTKIDNLSPKVPLAPYHIKQVKDSIKDRIYIKKVWQSASHDIYAYVPSPFGYVCYRLHFYENLEAANNYSVWRLQWVYACDEDFNIIDYLSVSGEWECALKLKDADDFMGGSTHGDEICSDYICFIDGASVAPEDITDGFWHAFRMVRNSTMYDPRDHETATALHGCEYVIDTEGLVLSQSVKWLVDATVTNCYMGMNLPKKVYSTNGYIDSEFDASSLPEYSRYPDAAKIVMWNANNGTFCSFENLGLTKSDLAGNNSFYFTDNSGNDYNKGYFCATYAASGVEISANTLWKSKTKYVYRTTKQIVTE